jgi:hypothetical protein
VTSQELNPDEPRFTPERLAELLEAADRRINALSVEVERSLGARTSTFSSPTPHPPANLPPPATPPATPGRLRLPAVPEVKAVVSRLTARWWRQGLGVIALGAATSFGAMLLPERGPDSIANPAAEAAPSDLTPIATSVAAAAAVARQSTSALTMTLSANAPCWVRAVADGVQTIERMLTVGETIEVRAEDLVVLRVGDAGALSVSVNGRAATTVGPRGQVVTRRFSRRDYADAAAS